MPRRRSRVRARIRGQGEVAQLIRDFGDIPPEMRRIIRPKFRTAAKPIVADAKRRASWSTRIPDAIKIKTSFAKRGAGLFIRVDSKQAPHARPYENLGEQGTFEHPTFGSWRGKRKVTQRARPFLFPAVEKGRKDMVRAAADAIDEAARLHGWR